MFAIQYNEVGIEQCITQARGFMRLLAEKVGETIRNETVPVDTGALRDSIKTVHEGDESRVIAGEPVAARPAPSNYAYWVEIGAPLDQQRDRSGMLYMQRGLLLASGRAQMLSDVV
jgi:hypothetical protein